MKGLCALLGMTTQNFYKERRLRERRSVDEDLVVALVKRERAMHPVMGVRKLLENIGRDLAEAGVSVGRDRVFEVLRERGLLVNRRRRTARTTDSRHGLRIYGNKLRGLELTGPDEAWVSDLTYIRTDQGYLYLALVMDAYSRRIMGYDVADTLEAEGCLRALRMAIGECTEGKRPMHHSDRGSQYCSHAYIELLKEHGMDISMTEENHCYENAKAERLNGILKQEYGLGENFRRKKDAIATVPQAVMLYNHRRPHTALGYKTPDQVHRQAA